MQPRAYPHRTLEIVGTQGTAVVHPILPPALQIDLSSAAGPYRAGVQKFEYPDFRQFVQDFSDLAAAVRGERKLPFTPEEDLLVQETLLRASGMAG
jgi:predicted dehydrogenase